MPRHVLQTYHQRGSERCIKFVIFVLHISWDGRFTVCGAQSNACEVEKNLLQARVSSKQTKINFGSNRNKPKQDLFRVCFGLFRETKNKQYPFVSVFRTYIETTETNRIVSKQTEKNRKKRKKNKKNGKTINFL